MSHRVYLLLDIADGKSEEVAQSLCNKQGVAKADLLEGPPDLIVLCEVSSQQKLAKLTVGVLASIDNVTENVCLLPVKSKSVDTDPRKLANQRQRSSETLNA